MKHTKLFKRTIDKILSAISDGFRMDSDARFVGDEEMTPEEIKYISALYERLEDEK